MVYANESVQLWMNISQLTSNVHEHLVGVNTKAYSSFLSDLMNIAKMDYIHTIWISPSASQAIYNRIPAQKRLIANSPVQTTKVIKNPTEEKGMRDCGIRDGIARVRHLVWLESQLNHNHSINEIQSAEQLERFQAEEALFQMLSFETISAFGPNAAIIHYSPNERTAAQINRHGLYLLDAGAQYLDCTTDVTRTHVFGTATDEQKKAYTLVLQG
jgi:Xaa-Pro aminopeptidase